MSTIEEIESAVARLTPSDYEKFRQWLSDYENRKWDRQLDEDSRRAGWMTLRRKL